MARQAEFVAKLPLFPADESLFKELVEFFCYLLCFLVSTSSPQTSPATHRPPTPSSTS